LFLGPPGAGKITVARIVANALHAVGVLKSGRLIEVNPVLEASSHPAGEAEEAMGVKLAKAIGGTLLLDHASVLLTATEQPHVATRRVLLQTMAKYRGQMAFIWADHADRWQRVLDQHPELASPFTHRLQFPDYTASQLGQIFQRFCDRNQYRVTRPAQIKLLLGFRWRLERDGQRCGYGHLVRQVFEEAVHRLAHRIAGLSPLTKSLLTTFEDSDLAVPGVPVQVWSDLTDPQRRFVITCPGCECENLVGPSFLGIRVECRRCHHCFVCAWGEPCLSQRPR
jgi:hypothetical protein